MQNFQYCAPTEVVFGRDVENQIGGIAGNRLVPAQAVALGEDIAAPSPIPPWPTPNRASPRRWSSVRT